MKIKPLLATLLTLPLFAGGYAQTQDKAKLDRFFDRLAAATRWTVSHPQGQRWGLGHFGAGEGGAGVLVTAASPDKLRCGLRTSLWHSTQLLAILV